MIDQTIFDYVIILTGPHASMYNDYGPAAGHLLRRLDWQDRGRIPASLTVPIGRGMG